MFFVSAFLMLIGRLLLATFFLVAVYSKFYNYDRYVAFMTQKKLPKIPLLLGLAIVIEFMGGIALVFGYGINAAALMLVLFLVIDTCLIHDFWNIEDPVEYQGQVSHFLKNLGLIGGLLYIAANGAGYFSF